MSSCPLRILSWRWNVLCPSWWFRTPMLRLGVHYSSVLIYTSSIFLERQRFFLLLVLFVLKVLISFASLICRVTTSPLACEKKHHCQKEEACGYTRHSLPSVRRHMCRNFTMDYPAITTQDFLDLATKKPERRKGKKNTDFGKCEIYNKTLAVSHWFCTLPPLYNGMIGCISDVITPPLIIEKVLLDVGNLLPLVSKEKRLLETVVYLSISVDFSLSSHVGS